MLSTLLNNDIDNALKNELDILIILSFIRIIWFNYNYVSKNLSYFCILFIINQLINCLFNLM